jgi:hypothetical protein
VSGTIGPPHLAALARKMVHHELVQILTEDEMGADVTVHRKQHILCGVERIRTADTHSLVTQLRVYTTECLALTVQAKHRRIEFASHKHVRQDLLALI